MRVGIIGHASRLERENQSWANDDTVFFTVREALENSGLSLEDIDTVVQAGDDVMDGIAIQHVYTVEPAGSLLKDESKVERDGAWAVHYAIAKLLSGKFRTAMVIAQSKGSQCNYSAFSGMSADPFYLRPVGLDGFSAGALQAAYFQAESGATEEDFALVAAKNRRNARTNDRAIPEEAGEFTTDQILSSPAIATPIRDLTAARAGDGCVVLLLASQEFIKERGLNAAYLTGVGLSSDVYYPTFRKLGQVESAGHAARAALKMAGVSVEAIDFVELHEVFAHQELMLYEALGLCPPGGARQWIQSGHTERDGTLPVNASGGALCSHVVYATGLARIMEAYLQLVERAGDGQLNNVKRALVHSQAGLAMQANIVYVLEN